MKIYISVDIEGVCGTTTWGEVTRGDGEYPEFQQQMTGEVKAACEGAFEAGATEIIIKDAHDTARNIIAEQLPESTRLIRGWSRHPYMMMQELDSSFDGALMLGYHSYGGGAGNPLAHTMSNTRISSVAINGKPASEFLINSYTAMLAKVPVLFVSGDQELCDHATQIIPEIESVAVKSGVGESTINIHPKTARQQIKEGVKKCLKGGNAKLQQLPDSFEVTVSYNDIRDSYKASFFPGAELLGPREVGFEAKDYFDVLRFFLFNL
ncbi:MAG: M55 family metallopeptidase [Desulforhopalus sp.]